MVIVPTGEPVEVEVKVENKDIGFVYPGQPVEVKVETFTFTQYGVVPGWWRVFLTMPLKMRSEGWFIALESAWVRK